MVIIKPYGVEIYIYMFLLYINIWQIVVRRNNIKLHVGHSCYGPLPIPTLLTLLNLTYRKIAFLSVDL